MSTTSTKKPNIFYIHTHDTGRYISPYGYNAETPRLATFAREAVLFRNAHCAAPSCSPSRAAMLTGQSAHSSGMLGLAHLGHALADPSRHLVHMLRSAGYTSILGGMQHEAARPDAVGYDQLLLSPDTIPTVDTVCPAFERFMEEPPAEPLFASIGFTETHRPFEEPDRSRGPESYQVPAPLPDTPETREDAAAFAASLRRVDEGIGRVFDAIRRAGLWEQSIVIVTTDHGPPFPEMKLNLTVHGTGVMLLMRGPGIWPGEPAGASSASRSGSASREAAGTVSDELVSQIDLYPTLCDAIGIEKPQWLEGRSLLPHLRGETDRVHDEIFGEINHHVGYEPTRSVRTDRYLYLRRFADSPAIVQENCDDGPSKSAWIRMGWLERRVPTEELYDTFFDPQERNNLADSTDHAEIKRDLSGRLDAWMARTNDPLLSGRGE